MSFTKILNRRRAVSPVIAAILLIGLTVAAGAVVYFMVFSQTDKADSTFLFSSASSEKVVISVSNSGDKQDR